MAPDLDNPAAVEDEGTAGFLTVNEDAHAAILEIMDMVSDDESSESDDGQSGAHTNTV